MNRRRPLPLIAAFAATTLCALTSRAGVAAESYGPYLDRAATRAHYAVLLRDAQYDDGADLKKVEENVHAYLRIAVSLAGRELHEEFRATAHKVQAAEEAIMRKDGANAYLAHAEQVAKGCAARVEANKAELLEAMNRYDAQQQFGAEGAKPAP